MTGYPEWTVSENVENIRHQEVTHPLKKGFGEAIGLLETGGRKVFSVLRLFLIFGLRKTSEVRLC